MCGAYVSPLGTIYMTSDDVGLTGLWFEGQRLVPPPALACMPPGRTDTEKEGVELSFDADEWRRSELGGCVCAWLDRYFAGAYPDFMPPLHLIGTPFRQAVWEKLLRIPYGATTTYGALARELARETGRRVAAQAVGNAVGHNPVSLLVPCHRVVGVRGDLTGYAGGIWRKESLLRMEQRND